MKSLVTIDVEGAQSERRYGTVNSLNEFLDEISIPTTLFVTPDVVQARPAVVSKWIEGPHTVGLHIHPERLGGNSLHLSEYSYVEIKEMVIDGVAVFEETLEVYPTTFRAGRWEYSDQLLKVLDMLGFEYDASLVPDYPKESFSEGNILEVPLSVYSDTVVKYAASYWETTRIPLWPDWFLPKRLLVPGFYFVTWRLLKSSRQYLMMAFHDYDIVDKTVKNRMRRYIKFLNSRTEPTTITEI